MNPLFQVAIIVGLAFGAMFLITAALAGRDSSLGVENARVPLATAGSGLAFAFGFLVLRFPILTVTVGAILAEALALTYSMFGGPL